jgi:apolipoprotein D and lipocalin family protein
MTTQRRTRSLIKLLLLTLLSGCSSTKFTKTVDKVEIDRFMGKWYVIAGRVTSFEDGAHNPIETYTFNHKKDRIDIDFRFNKDSLDGEVKEMPQKAWIQNKETNAYWEISPFWPLYFDYLVLALDKNYDWTVIGVPNQKYIWIMSRKKKMSEKELQSIISKIAKMGYNTEKIIRFPHNK